MHHDCMHFLCVDKQDVSKLMSLCVVETNGLNQRQEFRRALQIRTAT